MYITSRTRTAREETRNGTSIWWLLTEEHGARNFELRYIELAKSQSTTAGNHPWEHEVFIVKGWGVLRSAEGDHEVMEGDAIFIGPGEDHQFLNPWEDPMGFICVVPARTESLLRKR